MVHGDNQYDPGFVPSFVRKISDEGCDLVTGTRMVLGDVLEKGMPIVEIYPQSVFDMAWRISFLAAISRITIMVLGLIQQNFYGKCL